MKIKFIIQLELNRVYKGFEFILMSKLIYGLTKNRVKRCNAIYILFKFYGYV